MEETRIITWKTNHSGQEVECYVPQININGKWHDALSDGSYILKQSFNPVVLCKKCDGNGCQECNNRGFKKGISIDLKHIAQSILDATTMERKKAKEILDNVK